MDNQQGSLIFKFIKRGKFMRKISYEEIKKYIEQEGYMLLDYNHDGSHHHLTLQCPEGHIFSTTYNNFKRGRRCRECSKTKMNKNRKVTITNIEQEIKPLGFKIVNSEEYEKSSSIITLCCPKNHVFSIIWNNFKRRGYKCPHCNKEERIEKYHFKLQKYIESEGYKLNNIYFNDNDNLMVNITCSNNHTYDISWGKFKSRSRCLICNGKRKSLGEEKIKEYLIKNNIDFVQQKIFNDCNYKGCLYFDFYLPQHNICIEYDGIGHFEPTDFAGKGEEWAEEQFRDNQIRDNIKNNYCKNNNINLLRIPYWEFDNIENIIENKLKN